MATWNPPYMSGEEIYPDDPKKAADLEQQRDERMKPVTTVEEPKLQPPPGLKPNEILSWAGVGGAPASPLPTEPVPLHLGKKDAKKDAEEEE